MIIAKIYTKKVRNKMSLMMTTAEWTNEHKTRKLNVEMFPSAPEKQAATGSKV